MPLQPYDIVEVRRSPWLSDTKEEYRLDGEVVVDGNYTLQSKNERLSDVIRRAGGITEYAYPRGAPLDAKDDRRWGCRSRRGNATLLCKSQGADSISVSKPQMGNTYSVGIELEKALCHARKRHDIVIEGRRPNNGA